MRKYFPYFLIFVFISILLLVFFSQSNPVKFNTEIVPSKFSVQIPEYLSKTNSIDHTALLQFNSERDELFLLIYEKADTANDSLQTFFKKFSDAFILKIGRANLENYFSEKINGCNAFIGNIRGKVNETEVYYRIAAIQSGKSVFEIIIGTSQNNKSNFDEDMDAIIGSFKITSK